jgi:creatinine amidohydrolase
MSAWADLAWPDVEAAVRERPYALLPFGAVEEHGPHLPLGTDWYAADALADRLASSADLLRLPTMPYGQVWSLAHFPGSLSISDSTIVALVGELADGLRRWGVRGLVLFSAHLGNAAALRRAARSLVDDGLPALVLTYPGLKEVAAAVREAPESHPSIMHADELETSILLALHPDRVDMSRAVAEYPDYPADFDVAPSRWDAVSSTGVFGDATKATAEKGQQLVDDVIKTASTLVQAWKDRTAP